MDKEESHFEKYLGWITTAVWLLISYIVGVFAPGAVHYLFSKSAWRFSLIVLLPTILFGAFGLKYWHKSERLLEQNADLSTKLASVKKVAKKTESLQNKVDSLNDQIDQLQPYKDMVTQIQAGKTFYEVYAQMQQQLPSGQPGTSN